MSLESLKALKGVNMFSDVQKPIGYFDSGAPGLNYIISGDPFKGYPWGRMVEIFGGESIGKSTIAYAAIAKAQKAGSIVYLFDTEGAFDISQAVRCGIDPQALLYDEPSNLDELFKKMFNVIKELYINNSCNTPMLIVWDSVAASSLLENESSFDNNAMAALARKISPAVNKIMPMIIKNPITFLCVNQTRINLSGFRPSEDTPGGKTIKFYASVRLHIKRKGNWETSKDRLGIISEINCVKNKISRPFLNTTVYVGYEGGLNEIACLSETAKSLGVFELQGAYLLYQGKKRYKSEWDALLASNPELQNEVIVDISKALSNASPEPVVPPEEIALPEELGDE